MYFIKSVVIFILSISSSYGRFGGCNGTQFGCCNDMKTSAVRMNDYCKVKFYGHDYCGDVMGNHLHLHFNTVNNTANISANVLGDTVSCNHEPYTFSKGRLLFSSNQTDCLNNYLSEFGACPCPPNIFYDGHSDEFRIMVPNVENITFHRCQ